MTRDDGEREPVAYRSPLQNLADLSNLIGREQPRLASFVRGALVGALVGAAIAGSSLWRRRRRRRPPD